MAKNRQSQQRSRIDDTRSSQSRGRSGRKSSGGNRGSREQHNDNTRSANRGGNRGGMSSPGRRGSQQQQNQDDDTDR